MTSGAGRLSVSSSDSSRSQKMSGDALSRASSSSYVKGLKHSLSTRSVATGIQQSDSWRRPRPLAGHRHLTPPRRPGPPHTDTRSRLECGYIQMRPFSTSLLEVAGGNPQVFAPASFEGHISEQALEDWIVEQPDLLGEPLLILGRQLAEFAEDYDRLDVLAMDQDGEIVLIELKVSENFRVTDLQALAYAGAYASQGPADLAQTLGRHLRKLDAATTGEATPSGGGVDADVD